MRLARVALSHQKLLLHSLGQPFYQVFIYERTKVEGILQWSSLSRTIKWKRVTW